MKLPLAFLRKMRAVPVIDPGMAEHHHALVHVGPLLLRTMPDEEGRQSPAMAIDAMDLQSHGSPGDHLDEARLRCIAPGLAVFRAVDRVQPDPDPAPLQIDIDRVAVQDPQDLRRCLSAGYGRRA